MEPPPPQNRVLEFALVAIPVLFLLSLVALAAQAGFGHNKGATAPSDTYVSYAMTVFFILFVLMIPVAIYSFVMRERDLTEQQATPGRRAVRMLVGIGILLLLVWARHWIVLKWNSARHNGLFHLSQVLHQAQAKSARNGTHEAQPHFEWPVLWAAVAIGVALVAAWLWLRAHRPPAEVREAPTVDEQMAAMIDEAIDDLEGEPDPRRAVIAAYARMERTLGRHGLQRRLSETAIEYLRRVLMDITSAGGSVERLTGLFERAKFSTHEITGGMKEDAIASLREIREGLAT